MTRLSFAHHAAFVLRCSGAATLSYVLALALGLPHPIWATISSVIVCQEKLTETRSATVGLLLGTLIGVAVALVVGNLLAPLTADIAAQIAAAVALTAIVARRFPRFRVCMWTGPIVFLTLDQTTPLYLVALYRGAEVLLGGLIGAVLHFMAEVVLRPARGTQVDVAVSGNPPPDSERGEDQSQSAAQDIEMMPRNEASS